jgi:hypothetical protein
MYQANQYIEFAASGVAASQTAGQVIAFAIPDANSRPSANEE